MKVMEQAHHELERLQEVIGRHERHMFAVRGWFIAIVGGLLVALYSKHFNIDEAALQIALVLLAVLFIIIDSRHVNLIDAVVDRSGALEEKIREARGTGLEDGGRWYDGPLLSEACSQGVHRWRPKEGMTFKLNLVFYCVVFIVVAVAAFLLPPKG